MKYQDALLKTRALGLQFLPAHYNRVVPHNKTETRMHFLIKSTLVYFFIQAGEAIFTEFPIGSGVFDVFNLDRMTCYEIETRPSSTIQAEKRTLLQGYTNRIEILILDAQKFATDIPTLFTQIGNLLGLKLKG
jgi:hypothetical protein